MRFKMSDPHAWKWHFAWLPKFIGDEVIWLEKYQSRFKCVAPFSHFSRYERRLTANGEVYLENSLIGFS